MDNNAYEKVLLTAQKISFAYEDLFGEEDKRKIFGDIFDRYLLPVDPGGTMEPYYAIIALWKQNPDEFDQMLRELKEASLIQD